MQLLANYTKYYTAAIFTRKSLIYIGFLRAWISVIRWSLVSNQIPRYVSCAPMNIIILGAGRVGESVAESLVSEQNDITVIDQDPARLKLL